MTSCCEGFRLSPAGSLLTMDYHHHQLSPSQLGSLSKARIDALFEDSVGQQQQQHQGPDFCDWYSVPCKSNNHNPRSSSVGLEEEPPVSCATLDEEQRRVNGAVQARIEEMFAEETGGERASNLMEPAAVALQVKYMGAAPVGGRIASVRGLQEPLRQLLEHFDESTSAELAISADGLTFRTNNDSADRMSPFRRIAVWSALKLKTRRRGRDIIHAFVPLVGTGDAPPPEDDRYNELYRSMRGLPTEISKYSPIFAVVMRRPGASRLLECHAFACHTEEDAVMAAATLYRFLLSDLEAHRRRPRQADGLGQMSISAASVVSVASAQSDGSRAIRRPPSPPPLPPPPPLPAVSPVPIKPPRTKKLSVSSTNTDEENGSMCSNLVSVEKAPRRRKKLSRIKPDDVQQALENRPMSAATGFSQSGNRKSRSTDEVSCSDEACSSHHPFDVECSIENATRVSRRGNENHHRRSTSSSSSATSRNHVAGEPRRRSRSQRSEDRYGSDDPDHICRARENDIANVVEDIYGHYSQISRKYKNSSKSQNGTGRSRLARIDTMDRPVRKPPDFDEGDDEEDPRLGSRQAQRSSKRAGSEPPRSRTEIEAAIDQGNQDSGSSRRIKRSQSEMDILERGDPLTRVELPRRGSFLNPGSVRKRSNVEGGTPLGFTELFDEFRNQEGLTNVDDILAAIIDPEGMSFNELKPLYKEFLMKLAATLTQDELYQRSANIMRKRRRPQQQQQQQQRRRSMRRPNLLRRAIKRSVSRLKSGPTEFTSVIFPARRLNDSFGSSSSCEIKVSSSHHRSSRAHHAKPSGRKAGKQGNSCAISSNKIRNQQSTSEDSDNCRRIGRNVVTANRSSSGYVSCSECSYDSESCTCVSADRCYCSLSRKNPSDDVPANAACSCDTDSCSESNKCYCARKPIQPTILEQLRLKGIVPSESTISRDGSVNRTKSVKDSRHLTASKSLEYLQVRSSSGQGSSDNLALDYDLFSPGRCSQRSSNSEKVLVVSARDPQGRLIYVGGTERDDKKSNHRRGRSNGHHEALSIKKSAEIAAVFSNGQSRMTRASSASSLQSSVSLEAGLGYLP